MILMRPSGRKVRLRGPPSRCSFNLKLPGLLVGRGLARGDELLAAVVRLEAHGVDADEARRVLRVPVPVGVHASDGLEKDEGGGGAGRLSGSAIIARPNARGLWRGRRAPWSRA